MSSKRRLRRQACEGKVRYPSVSSAQASAYKQRRLGRYLMPYCCSFCGQWHLDHVQRPGAPAFNRNKER